MTETTSDFLMRVANAQACDEGKQLPFGERPAYWPHASEEEAARRRHRACIWTDGFLDGAKFIRKDSLEPLLDAAAPLIVRLEALGPGWADHSSALVPVGELRALAAAHRKATGQ